MAITAAMVAELRNITGAGMMDCKRALEESGGDLEKAGEYLRKKGISIAAKKASRDTNEGGIAIEIAADKKRAAIVQLACETDFVARNEQFQELLKTLAHQALEKGGQDFASQKLGGGVATVGETLTEAIGKIGENLRLVNVERVELKGDGAIGGYVHSNGKIGVLLALQSDKAVGGDALEVLAKDLSMHIAASNVKAISEDGVDPAEVAKEKDILMAQARESGKPENIIEKMVAGRINKYMQEITLLAQPFVKDPERTVKQVIADAGKAAGAKVTPVQYVKWQF
jgi:elongation factor Ts